MRRPVASRSVVLIAIALFAACGGSSSKSPASSGTGPNTTTSNSSGSTNGDLAKLYADAAKARFKITYTSGTGSETQTYAQDGKGNSVFGTADSKYFTSASGSVSCNTASGKATCLERGGATVNPFLTLFQAGKSYLDALGGRYGDVASKTIAGRAAKCVTISAESIARISGIKGSATYCIDKDTGVLLEISSTDASGTHDTSFNVTKFEEPTDSDFTPPATPSSAPGYTTPGQ